MHVTEGVTGLLGNCQIARQLGLRCEQSLRAWSVLNSPICQACLGTAIQMIKLSVRMVNKQPKATSWAASSQHPVTQMYGSSNVILFGIHPNVMLGQKPKPTFNLRSPAATRPPLHLVDLTLLPPLTLRKPVKTAPPTCAPQHGLGLGRRLCDACPAPT